MARPPGWQRWRHSGDAELIEGDVSEARAAISGRYLGPAAGARFAAERTKPGVLVLVVMIAGTGYALYSAQHDRITSPAKK